MQGIRLDEQALQIQLAEQLFELSLLVVFLVDIAGLTDCQTQRHRVEHYMGNERRPATCCGFDRAAQGFTLADELVETLLHQQGSGRSSNHGWTRTAN